ILSLVALGLFGGIVKTIITPRTYVATTSIIVENRDSQVAGVQVEEGKDVASPTIDSEVQALRAPELMAKVAEDLKLVRDPEFNSALRQPSWSDQLFGGSKAANQFTPEQQAAAALEKLQRNLTIRRAGLSFVITLTMRSEDPVKAARIVDAMARTYLQVQLDSKLLTTRQASEWLGQQVGTLQQQLQQQSSAVQAERAASGLIVGGGGSVADQQVRALTAQLSEARAELAAREARFGSSAGLGGGAASAGEVLASPVIQNLRQRESEANRKISELSIRFGPQHPQMQTARQEKADIERQIREETSRIVRGNSSELDVARRRVASLQSDLNGWTSKLTTETRRASKLQQLEGQAEATQRTYEGYVQRLQQVTDLEKLQRPDARILAKATIPLKPDTPRPALDLAMGLLAGLFGAVLVAAMLEGLQRGLRTPQAVEDWTGAPCLVSVPKLSAKNMRELTALDGKGPADYVALKPLSMYSEALRQMRADLILAPADGKAPQIVLFSSAVAGEGKSTTAFAFSRTLAMSGAKTILVEADIRRPSISSVSGLSAKHSLIDVIENHDLLSKAIKKDNLTDLHVMPSRSVDDRAGVDSALERLPLLLARLREQYQFIVIDTAPVLAVAETQVMAQCADAVILIVRWGATSGDAIRLAVRELEASRIQPRGVVLNSVDLEIQSRYTRGDAASYYQYYKKYYAK
ncbi:MAG: hypothetical protein RLZZ157_1535, partial [Pseudomonadota bacterium]